MADPGHRVRISEASSWEIATKVRLGKLPAASDLLDDLPQLIASQGFEPLPVTLAHGLHAGRYPMAHRDPFDRLLAAQALQAFPCSLLW